MCAQSTQTRDNAVCVSYMQTHTNTHAHTNTRIYVRFGHKARTLCYSSLCSSIHPHHQVITPLPHYPISTLQPAGVPPGNASSQPERPLEVCGAWGHRLPSGWRLILEMEMSHSPTLWTLIPHISTSIVWFVSLEGWGCVGWGGWGCCKGRGGPRRVLRWPYLSHMSGGGR